MSNHKSLQNLSLQELWELFPITLEPYNHSWQIWAEEEIQNLSSLLPQYSPTINHIGSTAIKGICAKPIVDILIEVSKEIDFNAIRKVLEEAGYICMAASDVRISFNKGYTLKGYAERVFHVHLHRKGDNDEIYFRDYLCSHPEEAIRYEALKQSLLPRFRNNRDAYTEAKTDFILSITKLAKNREANKKHFG